MRRAQNVLMMGVVGLMVIAMGATAMAAVGEEGPLDEEAVPLANFVDGDEDGVTDADETGILKMDPANPDSDSGFTTEVDEALNETKDGDEDLDKDGLTNAAELYTLLTDPLVADSDDDGLSDGDEVDRGTDPLDEDSDDDGLWDGAEVLDWDTDPLDDDSDDDMVKDGDEVKVLRTDPTNPDSDSAAVELGEAVNGTTDGDEDFDGDGISNADELNLYGTNPLVADDVIEGGACTATFADGVLVLDFDGEIMMFDLAEELTGKKLNHGRVVSTVAKAAPKECHGEIVSAVAQSDWGKTDDTAGEEPEVAEGDEDGAATESSNRGKNKNKAKGPKNKG